MQSLAINNFKRFWFGGIIIFIVLVLFNPLLITDISPTGVVEHQLAGTGDRVDTIQFAWLAADVLHWAKILMVGDLFFIGIYAFGASCGGILLRGDERVMVKRLGALIMAAAILFCITDYIETIAQIIQLFAMKGNDNLAYLAAAVNPFKSASFMVTLIGLLSIIIWDKLLTKRR